MGKKIQCIGKYLMCGTTLGKGSFARVELATHELTKCKVAVKVIDTRKITEEYTRNNLYREARILSQLRHPNIIRFYESLRAATLYCIITEWAQGGDLATYMKTFRDNRFPEHIFRSYFRQLLSALHYMHQRSIVHRDLKMENLLLDERKKNIKIVDFGLSNILGPDKHLHTHCGSPEYAAPELFVADKNYGPEVDVWSLGILSYTSLVGRMPFSSPYYDHQRNRRLLQLVNRGLQAKHHKEMQHLSADCQNILRQMIEPNPLLRLPLSEIQVHGWVTKGNKLPFTTYFPPPRDFSVRSQSPSHSSVKLEDQVINELAGLVDMPRVDVERSVAEYRSNELSAMFSMLLEAQKNKLGVYNRDHTLRRNSDPEVEKMRQAQARDKWRVLRSNLKQSAKVFRTALQERARQNLSPASTQEAGVSVLPPTHLTKLDDNNLPLGATAANFSTPREMPHSNDPPNAKNRRPTTLNVSQLAVVSQADDSGASQPIKMPLTTLPTTKKKKQKSVSKKKKGKINPIGVYISSKKKSLFPARRTPFQMSISNYSPQVPHSPVTASQNRKSFRAACNVLSNSQSTSTFPRCSLSFDAKLDVKDSLDHKNECAADNFDTPKRLMSRIYHEALLDEARNSFGYQGVNYTRAPHAFCEDLSCASHDATPLELKAVGFPPISSTQSSRKVITNALYHISCAEEIHVSRTPRHDRFRDKCRDSLILHSSNSSVELSAEIDSSLAAGCLSDSKLATVYTNGGAHLARKRPPSAPRPQRRQTQNEFLTANLPKKLEESADSRQTSLPHQFQAIIS